MYSFFQPRIIQISAKRPFQKSIFKDQGLGFAGQNALSNADSEMAACTKTGAAKSSFKKN